MNRRRHRRAVRPATGGDPEREVPVVSGDDDTDEREPAVRDTTARRVAGPGGPVSAKSVSADEQWLLDQRPPHWQ